MRLLHNLQELRSWRAPLSRVALVPTMGHLHKGHIALVHEAKQHAPHVIVSIFVNRLQFVQGEDFDCYPRTLEADIALLEKEGVDGLFVPDEKTLYPHGTPQYKMDLPAIQNALCGAFRPGHFQGVATVVAKLFNIVQPDVACFGKKDYQQLFIIKAMVNDLNMPVEIISVDIQRAQDGLALSSRNSYLSEVEWAKAPSLYRQLTQIKTEIEAGERDYAKLFQEKRKNLIAQGWEVDYIEVCSIKNLEPPMPTDRNLIVLAAAKIGVTRLIDNVEISI